MMRPQDMPQICEHRGAQLTTSARFTTDLAKLLVRATD